MTDYHPSTYTKMQIGTAFVMNDVRLNCVYMLDASYVLLSSHDADNYFFNLSAQVQNVLKGWAEDISDCDKYSRLLQSFAQVTHAKQWSKVGGAPAGLAVGVFNYIQDSTKSGHSINCLLTKEPNNGTIFLSFYEPQTGRPMELSLKERSSAFLVVL
jgi:hypothetical protein